MFLVSEQFLQWKEICTYLEMFLEHYIVLLHSFLSTFNAFLLILLNFRLCFVLEKISKTMKCYWRTVLLILAVISKYIMQFEIVCYTVAELSTHGSSMPFF